MLILPAKYVDEIKNKRTMSFNGFFQRSFFPNTPGFEGNRVTLESSVLKDAVRTKLTQSLGPVSLDLCEQTNVSVDEIYGNSKEWQPFSVRTHANNLIAILSTRVFLGERLIKNQEWIRITVDYTINMMIAVRTLKLVPGLLQPYLHWFVPHCILLRRDRTNARRIINEEIKLRNQERVDNAAKGIPTSKFADSLGWMSELAGSGPFDLAGAQLSLTFAAIHTTSDVVTKALYYIAADPAIADAMRKEAIEILTTEGWKKTSLTKMRFIDSLMKEVQRLHPAGISKYSIGTE
jgi:cytochrome P450